MGVDATFCLDYLFYFNVRGTLSPFMSRFEFGGLEPIFVMCFIYLIKSLSLFVLNLVSCQFSFFTSICYFVFRRESFY